MLERLALLLVLLGLAASLGGLSVARPLRHVVIQGYLDAGPNFSLEAMRMSADVRFHKLRYRIGPQGEQQVAFPSDGSQDVWIPRVGELALYQLEMPPSQRFALTVAFRTRGVPTGACLSLKFPNGYEHFSKPFRLLPQDPEKTEFLGTCPPISFPERLPQPPRGRLPDRPVPAAHREVWDAPEVDLAETGKPYTDDSGLLERVDNALFRINRISGREALACSELIQTRPTDERLRRVGILFSDLSQRKRQLYEILSQGRTITVDEASDSPELESADEAPLTEN